MREESQLLSKVLSELRKKLPEAVIFKHTDRLIRGVPDVSVTYRGMTTWIEAKVSRVSRIKIDPYQREVMRRLGKQGCAVYLIGRRERGLWRFELLRPGQMPRISTGGRFDDDISVLVEELKS